MAWGLSTIYGGLSRDTDNPTMPPADLQSSMRKAKPAAPGSVADMPSGAPPAIPAPPLEGAIDPIFRHPSDARGVHSDTGAETSHAYSGVAFKHFQDMSDSYANLLRQGLPTYANRPDIAKPSLLRQIGARALGFMAGFGGGAAQGQEVARSIYTTPELRQAQRNWTSQVGAAKEQTETAEKLAGIEERGYAAERGLKMAESAQRRAETLALGQQSRAGLQRAQSELAQAKTKDLESQQGKSKNEILLQQAVDAETDPDEKARLQKSLDAFRAASLARATAAAGVTRKTETERVETPLERTKVSLTQAQKAMEDARQALTAKQNACKDTEKWGSAQEKSACGAAINALQDRHDKAAAEYKAIQVPQGGTAKSRTFSEWKKGKGKTLTK